MHCVFSTISECMVFLIYEPLFTNDNINVSKLDEYYLCLSKGEKKKKKSSPQH